MTHVFETWFPFVASNLDEDTLIQYGRLQEDAVEWFGVDHGQRDGAGGFLDVLDQCGLQAAMPTARFCGKLRPAAYIGWLREHRKRFVPGGKLHWRVDGWVGEVARGTSDSRSLTSEAPVIGAHLRTLRGDCLAWLELPGELVTALRAYAADTDVSVNSVLVWAIARCVVPAFQSTGPDASLHIAAAANIRAPGNDDRSNHSPAFTVGVKPSDGVRDVHRQVKQILSGDGLIAVDRYYRFAGMLPKCLLRWRFRRDLASGILQRPSCHALFSNLGSWEIAGETSAWAFIPCALVRQPLVLGAISINQRFVIAIRLHRSIGLSVHHAYRALQDLERFLAACTRGNPVRSR